MFEISLEKLHEPLLQINLPVKEEPYLYHNNIDTNKFKSIYLEKFFTGRDYPREVMRMTLIHRDLTETQMDMSMEYFERFVEALKLFQIPIY